MSQCQMRAIGRSRRSCCQSQILNPCPPTRPSQGLLDLALREVWVCAGLEDARAQVLVALQQPPYIVLALLRGLRVVRELHLQLDVPLQRRVVKLVLAHVGAVGPLPIQHLVENHPHRPHVHFVAHLLFAVRIDDDVPVLHIRVERRALLRKALEGKVPVGAAADRSELAGALTKLRVDLLDDHGRRLYQISRVLVVRLRGRNGGAAAAELLVEVIFIREVFDVANFRVDG
mmetsp:Transcript_18997/g.47511  ORF Transcript_18997/g.47511 Transcript_18997/m.47511 type:complete len:231 (-) Transcript_18997:2787-3479(-)